MRGRSIRTAKARETFLKTLGETCNVSEACRRAGIGRASAYDWRDDDQGFAAAWAEAEQEAADRLEREAWRRGVDGIDKPITYQGKVTDTYREYSDRMLELLLKAHRPDKYVERREVTGKDGAPITVVEHRIVHVSQQADGKITIEIPE
jgi:hypothetical protein